MPSPCILAYRNKHKFSDSFYAFTLLMHNVYYTSVDSISITLICCTTFAFSALTMLVGCQEEHPGCKNWVMGCWCGYLSAARCSLFAYGPADATVSQNPHRLLPHLNPDWFYLSGIGLTRLSWKRGRQTGLVFSDSFYFRIGLPYPVQGILRRGTTQLNSRKCMHTMT